MAEGSWSVARVAKLTAAGVQKNERHNERKNESYANMNVDLERSPLNVHFKDTGGLTYNEYFQKLIDEGKISTRGLRENATLFNEMIVDVNTKYFEERGGYEYARTFYEEAYRFACGIYGEENIISAVMHADEINKAVTEELGKPVYHYHLHMALQHFPDKVKEFFERLFPQKERAEEREAPKPARKPKMRDDWAR